MKEQLSKIILGLQILVLVLPTTLFFGLIGIPFCMNFLSSLEELEGVIGALSLLFCAISIVAAWYSCVHFLRFGRKDLSRFPFKWKMIGYIGGIYVLVSWMFLALSELSLIMGNDDIFIIFIFGLYGTPLILPLLHLSLEWSASSKKHNHG